MRALQKCFANQNQRQQFELLPYDALKIAGEVGLRSDHLARASLSYVGEKDDGLFTR